MERIARNKEGFARESVTTFAKGVLVLARYGGENYEGEVVECVEEKGGSMVAFEE